MINMPLNKCLLAALSVLSCVGAAAPSTTPDVATKTDPEMRGGRSLGPAPAAQSLKDCAALGDETTCNQRDNRKVTRRCITKQKPCRNLCLKKNRKLSAKCKEACCPSSPSPPALAAAALALAAAALAAAALALAAAALSIATTALAQPVAALAPATGAQPAGLHLHGQGLAADGGHGVRFEP